MIPEVQPESTEFFGVSAECKKLDRHYVDHDGTMREPGVRLYCTQAARLGEQWCLQVRAPLVLAKGKSGRDFILANASLDANQLRQLRAMIDSQLALIAADEDAAEAAEADQ